MSAAGNAAGYLYASGRLSRKPCDKNRYDSELQALLIAADRVGKGAPPLRVYECLRCKAWHLTSKC